MRVTNATWPIGPAATPLSRASPPRASVLSLSPACRSGPRAPPTTCASRLSGLKRGRSLADERLVAERRRLDRRQPRHPDLYETEAGGFVTIVAGAGELAIRARETDRGFRLDGFVEIIRGRPHRIHIRLVAIWIKGLRKTDAGPDLLQFVVRELRQDHDVVQARRVDRVRRRRFLIIGQNRQGSCEAGCDDCDTPEPDHREFPALPSDRAPSLAF